MTIKNHCPSYDAGVRFAPLSYRYGEGFLQEKEMKKLTIVAEMPEAAGNALAYGDGHLDAWAEEALGSMLECDCGDSDTTWAADVERLFGFCEEDARSAFNVVEAKIEDMEGEEKEMVTVELDDEGFEKLEAVARVAGETPKACLTRILKEWVERKMAGAVEVEAGADAVTKEDTAADACEVKLDLALTLAKRVEKCAERWGVGFEDAVSRLLAVAATP